MVEVINFFCSCKLEGGSGTYSGSIVDGSRGLKFGISDQAVKQLFETVKNLYVAVATSIKI